MSGPGVSGSGKTGERRQRPAAGSKRQLSARTGRVLLRNHTVAEREVRFARLFKMAPCFTQSMIVSFHDDHDRDSYH